MLMLMPIAADIMKNKSFNSSRSVMSFPLSELLLPGDQEICQNDPKVMELHGNYLSGRVPGVECGNFELP